MFNADFYPTPQNVIELMLFGQDLENKAVLEPSAGKGDIVDYCTEAGATVIACEVNADLKKILQTKCKVIADDFLTVTSEQISHIDFIIMNPPFTADEKHILHAYSIAPAGCKIIALCNLQTIQNAYSKSRKELCSIVENYGSIKNLKDCFSNSERQTSVEIALLNITKPGQSYKSEFEGFFTDEEPDEQGEDGIMSYNVVRDLVNRYVSAVKLYDEQLTTGTKMNNLLNSFYGENLTFTCTEAGAPKLKTDFKKDLQKAGWKFIFFKMNMNKHSTTGLRADINKFVEQQTEIPFTMKNIYKMLEIVAGTTSQRMDKSILEVFDNITEHHHENRHNVKGWKTNSHFLVGKKFILPYMVSPAKEYGYTSGYYSHLRSSDKLDDFEKALCFLTGFNYDILFNYETREDRPRDEKSVGRSINRNIYGEWYTSHFFRYKAFKNGNMHFEFMNEDVWGKFNQKVAEIKGYPLFEAKAQTKYQERNTGRTTPKAEAKQKPVPQAVKQSDILFSFSI